MRSEVVHEEVMGVIDEEVECIKHVSVVNEHWHLNCLLDQLLYLGFSP